MESLDAQYPTLDVKYTRVFHDRFLILDREAGYQYYSRCRDYKRYIAAFGIGNGNKPSADVGT